jgi:hypothetical protein
VRRKDYPSIPISKSFHESMIPLASYEGANFSS